MLREFRFIANVPSEQEADYLVTRFQQVADEFHITLNGGYLQDDPEEDAIWDKEEDDDVEEVFDDSEN